jgi:hypothetical protein
MTTQPIIVDLINNVVLHVGSDPVADKKYAEILAAQQSAVTTSGPPPK